MLLFLTEPDLFDIDAWRDLREDIAASPASALRTSQLASTEAHIAAIEAAQHSDPDTDVSAQDAS